MSGKEAVSTLRHFGKLSCDQKNDRSFPLVRWTTNRSSRLNKSESLLQVNTCSDKRLLLVVTLPVWIIYCFIFYDWLNLYLDTHSSVLEARIFLEDWESSIKNLIGRQGREDWLCYCFLSNIILIIPSRRSVQSSTV